MIDGIIFDIKKFSLHDGPGIRTTVFFKGCPLHCWWCHNPESQPLEQMIMVRESRCIRCGACLEVCPQQAIAWEGEALITNAAKCDHCGACVDVCYADARELVGRTVSVEQVMAEVGRDIPFYDQSGGGVTFSGGEPLRQRSFLLALLRACKEQEIHTALDTSGFATWETLDSVRPYVDLFLYDLKLMDDACHRRYTGVANHLILSNLQALSRRGHHFFVRVPIIPGITDDTENLRQIAVFVVELPGLLGVDILPYHQAATGKYQRLHKVYELPDTPPPSDERMDEIAHLLRGFGLPVKIGG